MVRTGVPLTLRLTRKEKAMLYDHLKGKSVQLTINDPMSGNNYNQTGKIVESDYNAGAPSYLFVVMPGGQRHNIKESEIVSLTVL